MARINYSEVLETLNASITDSVIMETENPDIQAIYQEMSRSSIVEPTLTWQQSLYQIWKRFWRSVPLGHIKLPLNSNRGGIYFSKWYSKLVSFFMVSAVVFYVYDAFLLVGTMYSID